MRRGSEEPRIFRVCSVCCTPFYHGGKHMKKSSILILLLTIAILTMACDRPEETTNQTTSSTTQNFPIHTTTPTTTPTSTPLFGNETFFRTEPYPYTKFYGGVNGKIYVSDNITYHYEETIPDDQCISATGFIEQAIKLMDEKAGSVQEPCNVYIFRNEYAPRAFEHGFYAGVENLESQDMLISLILAHYGYDLNYGLAYALSCEIAEAMGITYDNISPSLNYALLFVQANPAFLDMNYPCFSPFYAETDQIMLVKSLARHFYGQLQAEERYDLFREFTNEKYCTYLSSFLAEYNLPTYDNSDLAGTVFYNGGLQTQMSWKNAIGDFFIENGYTITYPDAIFPQDMVNSGYTNLRKIVVDYIAQAEYVQGKLAKYELNPAPLTVLFMADKVNVGRGAAVYLSEKNEIHMFGISPFLHEYTHYLTEGYFTGWKWEVLPTYYANFPVNEQINYIWYSDMLTYTNLDPNNPDDLLKYEVFEGVKSQLNHPFDWTSMEDFQYLLDAYTVKRGWLDRITNATSGVATKSSFFHFLVKLEGEDAATAALMEDTPEVYFDHSWNDLINLWKQDLNTRFAWVNS